MKSINIFWLFMVLCVANGYGQVLTGINTVNAIPSQRLHVKGTFGQDVIKAATGTNPLLGIFTVKPTIRIEGLNKVNNASFAAYTLPTLLTTASYTAAPYSWTAPLVQPVSVTQDGDLLLSRDYVIPLVATKLGDDALTSTNIPATATDGSGSEKSLTGNTGYSFTITQTCMVHFMASVSVSIYKTGGTAAKTALIDKVNRAYHVHFRFISATFVNPSPPVFAYGIATNNQFGTDGNSYTNTSALGSTGDMYANPEAYLILPPGTYKVDLVGRSFGYTNLFDAVYGGGTDDRVSIIATPLN